MSCPLMLFVGQDDDADDEEEDEDDAAVYEEVSDSCTSRRVHI
jgi:hypothetical protein